MFSSIILYNNYDYIFNDQKIREIVTIGNLQNANEKDLSKKLDQILTENIYKLNLRDFKISL